MIWGAEAEAEIHGHGNGNGLKWRQLAGNRNPNHNCLLYVLNQYWATQRIRNKLIGLASFIRSGVSFFISIRFVSFHFRGRKSKQLDSDY